MVQVSGDYVRGRLSRNRLRNKNVTSYFCVPISSNKAMYQVKRFESVFLDTMKARALKLGQFIVSMAFSNFYKM